MSSCSAGVLAVIGGRKKREKKKRKTNKQTLLFISPLCFFFAVCSQPRVCLGPGVCESSPCHAVGFSFYCLSPSARHLGTPSPPLPSPHTLPHSSPLLQQHSSERMLYVRAKSLCFWRRQLAALVLLQNGSRKFFPDQNPFLMLYVRCDENRSNQFEDFVKRFAHRICFSFYANDIAPWWRSR